MSQINIDPGYRDRDIGVGTVLAVVLVIALVAFLVWALAFSGWATVTGTGAPAYSTPGVTRDSGPNVNIAPNVNVAPPAQSGGTNSGSNAGTGSSAGIAPAPPTSGTAPAKP